VFQQEKQISAGTPRCWRKWKVIPLMPLNSSIS